MALAAAPLASDNDIIHGDQAAAALLGQSPRTIRLWRMRRGLPHFKVTGKVILFRRADILAWLENHRVVTIS